MTFAFKKYLEEDTSNNTLVVDALNLAFRWKHTPNFNSFREDYLRTVESIANSYRSKKIIIAADWKSSSFRKNIFPAYKADRKERFADQTEQEAEQFEQFFAEYEAALALCGEHYPVLRYEYVEADDIAAYIVKNRKKFNLESIWLLSSDGDWDLLVREGVNRFTWRTRKEITIDNWDEHYKVPPEQFLDYKCLTGDKSDNIPGVTGVGQVRAAALLKQYDTIFDLHASLPISGKAQYIKNLNETKDQLLINVELMDLMTYCEDAIGEENIKHIDETLNAKYTD